MLVPLLIITTAGFANNTGYRLAAIIAKGPESMALVEDADGDQKWYRVGDDLDGAQVVQIDGDGITLLDVDGDARMTLRAGITKQAVAPTVQPREQLKHFQYLGLLSRINAVDRAPGESREQAVSRNINHVLGLADRAKITAIGRVKVSTPRQAQAELARRLSAGEPVRISIDDDERVLYIMPDE